MFTLNAGDPIQVFEYILSKTEAEKIKTFKRSFKRVRTDYKEYDNIDKLSNLENRITSVYDFFNMYIKGLDRVDKELLEKITNKHKKILNKIKEKILAIIENQAKVEEKSEKSQEIHVEYNEESFYDMESVFSLIKKAKPQSNSNCNTLIKTAKLIASTNLKNILDLPQPTKNLYQCISKM